MTEDPRTHAVHWMLRLRAADMDEAEWDAFTAWLEESPAHPALLDEVQAADEDLAAIAEGLAPSSAGGVAEPDARAASNENDPALPRAANDNPWKRLWPFAGLVAAAVAVFALWPLGPSEVLFSTEPGETRIVEVSDEITMTLNGGSEVTLVEDDTRVRIARGEVAFNIDSQEPSPLRVEVADLVLADYGTIFNVVLGDDSVSVAVAEGMVGINPDAENVEVAAGEQVTRALSSGSLVRSEVDPDTVGSWRQGRLEFDNTLAREAVAMLERSIGSRVTLAEALEGETLTGSLVLSDDEAETVTQFAAFLGARAHRGRLEGGGMVWDLR